MYNTTTNICYGLMVNLTETRPKHGGRAVQVPCPQSRPGQSSKSLPIHCVIEQSPANSAHHHHHHHHQGHAHDGSAPIVVLDSYAILPGATPFCDVVSASLGKLGYSSAEARQATGGIQLKNWKTLPLEAITDRREATIEEMLGELTSVATLRVQLTSNIERSSPASDEVKDKLLQLLLTQSKDLLLQAGCPIEKVQLDELSAGKTTKEFSDSVCSAFHRWYARQVDPTAQTDEGSVRMSPSKTHNSEHSDLARRQSSLLIAPSPTLLASLNVKKELSPCPKVNDLNSSPEPVSNHTQYGSISNTTPTYKKHGSNASNCFMSSRKEEKMSEGNVNSKTRLDNQASGCHSELSLSSRDVGGSHAIQSGLHYPSHALLPQATGTNVSSGSINNAIPCHIPSINGNSGNSGSPFLGLMPGKTRIRTSFDPEHEIPRLHKWFSHNQHPTREQMLRYMHELNGLESRRGRRPLDLTNIIYWFKNARAAQRRACKALDDSIEDPSGAGEDGRSGEDNNGHTQMTETVADNGDNQDNGDGAGGLNIDGNNINTSAETNLPPYLPNKNAVYMIPFHPYLQGSVSNHTRMSSPLPGVGPEVSSEDQPYDLSLTKRRHSQDLVASTHKRQAREAFPTEEEDEKARPGKSQDLVSSQKNLPFSSKSPNISENETEGHTKRNDSSPTVPPFFLPPSTSSLCPPHFPALLDAASKMRQEIPAQSDEEQATTTLTFPRPQRQPQDKNHDVPSSTNESALNGIVSYNGFDCSGSPRSGDRGKEALDKSSHSQTKHRESGNPVASPRASSLHNGTLPSHLFEMNIKEEVERDTQRAREEKRSTSPRSRQNSNGAVDSTASHSPDSGLELGQIHKEDVRPGTNIKQNFSDEDDFDNDDNVYRRDRKNSFVGGRSRGGANSHYDHDSGEELEYHSHRGSSYQNHQQHPLDNLDLDSEAELLKLRLKQSKDYADYASAAAMHSNVSRLTAANMAALSLAQMGGLHLPQLPPSLAMAYYPMDPRFYSAVGPPPPHSSSPTPLTRSSAVTPSSSPSTISPHLHSHLHPHHADSRSPLPSPSAVSMAQSIPQLNHLHAHPHQHQSLSPSPQHQRGQMNSSEPRKRRTRVFIDPLTEIPKLEKWFLEDTHPSAFMIDKFCEELNTCEYRHKFPKLEPKNVQLWFKNHRAKVKRMKTVSTSDGSGGGGDVGRDDMDEDLDD
ncbi:DNA-binding protein SATB2 [Elysia marginata]|uniref:DNA-binding protein SATB2 n=1 Tax=Elysia marginata TaxID=1093978 RepID=A0AAV4IFW4_9GAST|nr:DNA-binding protein SATB2 [Elysia marginata]